MTQPQGLRERKRRETRSRIIDSATALVEQRGFDAVTVEEICADADISKRTFFNYMESKDEAVLGTLPVAFDGDRLAHFVETPSDNLVFSALSELAALVAAMDYNDDAEFQARIRARRMNITATEPSLALISFTRYRDLGNHLRDAMSLHFEAHPGDRRLPDISAEEESATIVAVIRETLFLASTRSPAACPSPEDLLDSWVDAAKQLTTLSKGFDW